MSSRSKSKRQRVRRNQDALTSANSLPTASLPGAAPLDASSLTVSRTQIQSYVGPVPPPAFLREFEELVPGTAAMIFRVFEHQAEHRMKMEDRALGASIVRQYLGWASATLIGVIGIGGGIALVYAGHDWGGASIAAAVGSGLAATFITGRIVEKKERVEKAKNMKR